MAVNLRRMPPKWLELETIHSGQFNEEVVEAVFIEPSYPSAYEWSIVAFVLGLYLMDDPFVTKMRSHGDPRLFITSGQATMLDFLYRDTQKLAQDSNALFDT